MKYVKLGNLIEVVNIKEKDLIADPNIDYPKNNKRYLYKVLGKYELKDPEDKFKNHQLRDDYKIVPSNCLLYNATSLINRLITVNITDQPYIVSNLYQIFCLDIQCIIPKYMYYYVQNNSFTNWVRDVSCGSKRMTTPAKLLSLHQIPLPPLEKQQEIVARLDVQAAILERCKKIVKHWKPNINFDGYETR